MYPHFDLKQYFVPVWEFRDKAFKKEIKTFQININMWVQFKQDHPHIIKQGTSLRLLHFRLVNRKQRSDQKNVQLREGKNHESASWTESRLQILSGNILQQVSCLSEDGHESLRQLGREDSETEPPLPLLHVFSSLGGSECKHSSSVFSILQQTAQTAASGKQDFGCLRTLRAHGQKTDAARPTAACSHSPLPLKRTRLCNSDFRPEQLREFLLL